MSQSIQAIIAERRSIKKFNGRSVSQSDIVEILDVASWAPNHGNREPWRFIVAAENGLDAIRNTMKECTIPNWGQLPEEEIEKKTAGFKLPGAFVFVVVPEDVRQKERLEDFSAASALIQNAQLLAWGKGIGTCWKTPAWMELPKFRQALDVKPGERILAMLQFGYYDELPKAKARTPIEQKITYFG
ncbi:nitroreductase family protein [Domibacillus epiphyticus]|uniref:Putative NAD(P)H nitroreductase n=1 Tax=Domibacillus epiphyticus TaxID=1714355 RepID=A0A1V2A6T6_9BACI|nr:nitroreductase [Domibacillus epiphyticus]OMP66544.1 nitroreductase [Domibacillus epiphyticus]